MVDATSPDLRQPGADAQPPVDGRGSTTIADRVLARLAQRLALEVSGVVRHSSGGPGPLGSTYPTSSVERTGGRARMSLAIAVEWEAPADDTAADVRDTVRRRLAELTGATIDRVDVRVAALVPTARRTDITTRRRVE